MAVRAAMDSDEGCGAHGRTRQPPLEVDIGCAVLLQVLLLRPLLGVDSVKVVGVELEVLGATKGEILYLASMSRQMLDG